MRSALALLLLVAPAAFAASVDELVALAPGLRREVADEALRAVACAHDAGIGNGAGRLAIIDYTLPSRERRLWVFDLGVPRLSIRDYVAHGQGSGHDVPTHFSNRSGSHQSSLGLFTTADTYHGGNGYSLRMDGHSGGLNSAARDRMIVMHGAPYVNPAAVPAMGRLGRSWGCPALRPTVAQRIIDELKDGQFIYAYGPGSAAAASCGAPRTLR